MSCTYKIDFGGSKGGGGGRRTVTRTRYHKGWRSSDQDSRPVTRAARIAAQGRSFQAIRDECLSKGVLWEDPDFPATDRSLFYSRPAPRGMVWKRPGELCENPRMMVEGVTRFDVMQGELGNCWFLAAVASLCASCNRKHGNKEILYKVVPLDNSFVQGYAGVFHFQIWQYGQWVDVVIDDRLPTLGGRLVYMHSAQNNEFWSALLEKAYAKLNGGYETLRGGSSSEAMEDFTGGICETFDMKKDIPKKIGSIMLKAHERHSLMACQIDVTELSMESVLANGLVVGHAYSITSVLKINVYGQDTILVRLRNPWGNETEWNGPWSDGSREWTRLSEEERQRYGIIFDDDGEFWMSLSDFMTNFNLLEICSLRPDFVSEEEGDVTGRKRWETSVQEGSWRRRVNAGGCRNFLDTYWTNPQYKVEVMDADEDDDDNTGTLIVALMQKERRKKRQEGLDYLTIGFSIYKLPEKDCGPLDLDFFKYNRTVARSIYCNTREVCMRFSLEPGHYAIIPSTFKPNEEGDFVVRTVSERPAHAKELDEKTRQEDDNDDMSSMFRSSIRTSTGDGGWTVIKTSSNQDDGIWANQWRLENPGDDFDSLAKKIEDDMKRSLIGPGTDGPSEPKPQPPSTDDSEEKRDGLKRRIRTHQVTDSDVDEQKQAWELFKQMSGPDRDMDAYQFRELLNATFRKEFAFDGFSLETCRSMVAMKDVDKSGKLEYQEFKKLWAGLRQWKKIFKEFDLDRSGTFNSFELRKALNSAGIYVSNSTFNGLVMRYSDQKGRIFFDDFVHCAVRLRTMFEIFGSMEREGKARFGMDEFIQTTMYS